MKKRLLLFLLCFSFISSYGQTFNLEGIIYQITSYTLNNNEPVYCAEVIDVELEGGDIVIPKSIFYDGKDYPVKYIWGSGLSKVENVEIQADLLVFEPFIEGSIIRNLIFSDDADIKSLSLQAVGDCENLETIIFPKNASFKTIPNNFAENCISLREVVLPDAMEIIGDNAFKNTGLESVKLPVHLKRIGFKCYSECPNLREVILPSGLKEICGEAFGYNPNLEKVVSLAQNPPEFILENENGWEFSRYLEPFYGSGNKMLYTPYSMRQNYMNNEFWWGFNISWDDYYWDEEWKNNCWYVSDLDSFDNFSSDFIDRYCRIDDGLSIYFQPESISEIPFEGLKNLNFQNDLSEGDYRYALVEGNCRDWEPQTVEAVSTSYKIELDKWYFLSFPFDVNVDDIHLKTIEWNQDNHVYIGDENRGSGFSYFDFAIRYYDGEIRAIENSTGESWQDVPPGTIIKAGSGIIARAGSSFSNFNPEDIKNFECEIIFPGTGDFYETVLKDWRDFGGKEIYLADCFTDNTRDENRGWNLIGNPYHMYYDLEYAKYREIDLYTGGYYDLPMNQIVTIYDSDESTYRTYAPFDEKVILEPSQAFFVQIDNRSDRYSYNMFFNGEGLRLGKEMDSDQGYFSRHNARKMDGRYIFNLKLTGNNHNDETRVVLNADASLGYEINKDATKFLSENLNVPQIYSINDNNTKLAINERPAGSIKIGYYAPSTGEMTLSFPRVEGVAILHDNDTGKKVLLREGEEYRFTTENVGRNETRFSLEIQNAEATGIEEINDSLVNPQIGIENNHITIENAKGAQLIINSIDGIVLVNDIIRSEREEFSLSSGCYCVTVDSKSTKCVIK